MHISSHLARVTFLWLTNGLQIRISLPLAFVVPITPNPTAYETHPPSAPSANTRSLYITSSSSFPTLHHSGSPNSTSVPNPSMSQVTSYFPVLRTITVIPLPGDFRSFPSFLFSLVSSASYTS